MYRRVRNWLVVGCLLILGAGFLRYRMEYGPIREVDEISPVEDTMVADRGEIRITVSATGSISPAERLPMFFVLPGTVAEVLVDVGDVVYAGQPLARIETSDLEFALRDAELALQLQQVAYDMLTSDPREEDLAVARAAVNAAYAQLVAAQVPPDQRQERMARLQVELARNQLWQAQLQRDQTDLLADFGITSEANALQAEGSVNRQTYEVDIAEQQLAQVQNQTVNQVNVASAQAALANAQSGLQRLLEGPGEIDLEIADAQLQTAYLAVETARNQIEKAVLEAPFDGIVAALDLVPGEAPPATGPALELIDTSSYFIDLAVDEIDIAQVAVGQPVEITLDALPGTVIAGRVVLIDQIATNLGGVITYRVRIQLDAMDVTIRVGMSATATIIVDEVADAVRVRNRFIRLDRRSGEAFITVRRADGALEEVEVLLGRRNETYSEIISGVQAGEEIVLLPRDSFDPFSFTP